MQNNGNGNGNGNGNLVRRISLRDETGKVVGIKSLTYYADLISSIQEKGILKELRTEIVQLPAKENNHLAVVKATVITGMGVFTGLGDASPISVEKEFVPHLLRVAETRAKARALRDALGIGVVAAEELILDGKEEAVEAVKSDANPSGNGSNGDGEKKEVVAPQISAPANPASATASNSKPIPMTDSQRRILFRLLQTRGIEGDKSKEFLKENFHADDLRLVTKEAADLLITELKKGNGAFPESEAAHA
jgi:hypothetical protein